MMMQRVLPFLLLVLAVALTAGCASDSSARDPKPPGADEHQFHSNQEHYDRSGSMENKP